MGTEDKYKKLFGYINLVEPPRGLGKKVMARIRMEEKRLAKIRTWIFGGSSVASFGFSLWALTYLIDSVKQTGFWNYLSLIFSENGAVLAYWRELSLSLIESLPIIGLIMSLAAIGIFIWSLGKISPPTPSYFKRGFLKVSS